MLFAFVRQKIASIEIWRPLLCLLFLVSLSNELMDFVFKAKNEIPAISFYEFYMELSYLFNILLTVVVVLFFMTDVYGGTKNTFQDSVFLRLKGRFMLSWYHVLYIAFLSLIMMAVLLTSALAVYLLRFGLDAPILEGGRFHMGSDGNILFINVQDIKAMGLTPLTGFWIQLAFTYLYIVLWGCIIFVVNLLFHHHSLGFLVFFLYHILQILVYFILQSPVALGIFPYEHLSLFYSTPANLELLTGKAVAVDYTNRLPYAISFVYYGASIGLLGAIGSLLAGRRDFMTQEGVRE